VAWRPHTHTLRPEYCGVDHLSPKLAVGAPRPTVECCVWCLVWGVSACWCSSWVACRPGFGDDCSIECDYDFCHFGFGGGRRPISYFAISRPNRSVQVCFLCIGPTRIATLALLILRLSAFTIYCHCSSRHYYCSQVPFVSNFWLRLHSAISECYDTSIESLRYYILLACCHKQLNKGQVR